MLLDNRYQVVEELGEGAFGKTFIAEDHRSPTRRKCVVKQLKLGGNDNDNRFYQSLFEREAIVLEQVGNQAGGRIPRLLASFSENGAFYFVMELVPGKTLADRIAEKGKLDEETVRAFLVKTLETLEFLHQVEYADADGKTFRGIIHRDIKPGNIIVRDRDDAPILIDFGVVKEIVARSTVGQGGTMTKLAGTQFFMPFEQQQGRPTLASDLHALGVTALVALTGQPPVALFDPDNLVFEWRNFAPEVTDEFADILDKATVFQVKKRFQSAREMIEALKAKIEPVVTPPPEPEPPVVVIAPPIVEAKEISIPVLLKDLNALLPAQFEEVLLILNVPVQFLPGKNAPQAERVAELIRWAQTASALEELKAVLREFRPAPTPVIVPPARPDIVIPQPLAKTFKNSIGMEFVLVPAGKFKMGGDDYDWEKPVHDASIGNPFYLGKYQVTQGQWKAVMNGANPSHFKGDDRLPVDSVSWNDCQDFLKKLNLMEKDAVYRLPSESEWEYACRAGTTDDYAGKLDEIGWYFKNSETRTHPVGLKDTNKFDLHDMHGNVWEWCQDRWHGNYNGAPDDGSAWETGNSEERVLRGGSWRCSARDCRSANRVRVTPSGRGFDGGLRVVMIPART